MNGEIKLKKSTITKLLITIACYIVIVSILQICTITMGSSYDKGKYFLCQTHAKLFLIAHDGLGVEDVIVKSMKSKPKKVEINFERFTMKGEANSYITSFIFGIPIGLNSNTIIISDGDMQLIAAPGTEFEVPFTEEIDKEQEQALLDNFHEVIDWACDMELRIIIVRLIILVAAIYVVIKKSKTA